ncbi:MAG: hypothetical protein IJA78_02320, partial [Clostridia bacterium]|nr:hypothetical protein [Clostridia bacterium]
MMKKTFQKIGTKSLAILLSVLMVIAIFPLSVVAAMMAKEPTEQAGTGRKTADIEYLREPFELVELREENVKYFQQVDGTRVAAVYDHAVHYLDENGVWQDIDNTLTQTGSEYTTRNARVKFAKKITGNETLMTLHEHNRKITWSLNDATKKTEAQVFNTQTEHPEDATQLQKLMTLDKLNSTILYTDILDGVDLEYIVTSNNIKENIIVKAPKNSYSFSFTLKLNGLVAILGDEGSVQLLDSKTHELYYVIPAGYMVDAGGAYSQNVTYTLSDNGNGSYQLQVTADSAWINSPDRVFPVKIDPTVTPSTYYTNQVQIMSHGAGFNWSNFETVTVAGQTRAYWKKQALPIATEFAHIISAEYSIYVQELRPLSDKDYVIVGAYDVLTDWDNSLTWNKMSNESNPQGTIGQIPVSTKIINQANKRYSLDITQIARKWYNGNNYGLCLTFPDSPTIGYIVYAGIGTATANHMPSLTVNYESMIGMEDYWSYLMQDAGFAGSGAVNYASGQLTFAIPTLTTTDALFAFTPTLYYNTVLSGATANTEDVYSYRPVTMEPYGFKWNMMETLYKLGDRYIWSDGDGTTHSFYPTTEGGSIYKDVEGLFLTLKVEGNFVTITDSAGNVHTFAPYAASSENYALTSIRDASGNVLSFQVDANLRPCTIVVTPNQSSAITQLNIYYTSSGMPYLVLNATSQEAVILRYSDTVSGEITSTSSGYLRQVIRAHGSGDPAVWEAFYNTNLNISTTITSEGSESGVEISVDAIADYAYDYNGYMQSITNNLSQYCLYYEYGDGARVITVRENAGADNVAGQKLTLSYGGSNTVVRTSGADDTYGNADDLLTTHCCDMYGRVVTSYTTNLDQTQFYGSTHIGYEDHSDNYVPKNSIKGSLANAQFASNYLSNGSFEQQTDDGASDWTQSGNALLSTANPYHGKYSIMLASNNNDASISQTVNLRGGTYTLSFMVYSSYAGNGEFHLYAEIKSGDVTRKIQEIPLNEYYATGGKYLASIGFDAMPAAGSTTEAITVTIKTTGTVSDLVLIDAVMLARAIGNADYDMVSMGHFENTRELPASSAWKIEPGLEVVNSGNSLFNNVMMVPGDYALPSFSQVIYEASDPELIAFRSSSEVPKPMLLTLSGWAKSEAASMASNDFFDLSLQVDFYSKNGDYTIEYMRLYFDRTVQNWQLVAGTYLTDPDKGMVALIKIIVRYKKHPGNGYFDNITLVKDSASADAYVYGDNGRVETHQSGQNTTRYTYNENENLSRVEYTDGSFVEYTYDSAIAERVTKEEYGYVVDGSDVVLTETAYTYNQQGLLARTDVTDKQSTSGLSMQTETVYEITPGSHIFGVVTHTQDHASSTSADYFYDSSNGRLLAAFRSDANGESYVYDAIGNLTNVYPAWLTTGLVYTSSQDDAVSYTYDATNRLSTITTDSTVYTLTYDVFGNQAAVSAGTHTLASYTYNANNGKLATLTYGNGLQVRYVYDALDRVSQIQYNIGEEGAFETVYSYTYDAGGRLHSVTDHEADKVTVYGYGGVGRMDHSHTYSLTGYNTLYANYVIYDDLARVSKVTESLEYFNSSSYVHERVMTQYTYNAQNRLATYELFNGSGALGLTVTPSYDNFGRMLTRTQMATSSDHYVPFYRSESYEYASSKIYDSTRISAVTVSVGTSASDAASVTYRYTYGACGNITEIRDASNTVQYRYAYDALGQLIREDNRALNQTLVYTYDGAGNIESKTVYAFTTSSTLGAVQ